MQRYYFHASGAFEHYDAEGLELNSVKEARLRAVIFAGGLMLSEPERALSCPEWTVNVSDGSGDLFAIRISVDADNER